MNKITILLTDDHTLVRQTWVLLLNHDSRFTVVGECGSGEQTLELARGLRPDVIIMDINLPGISGMEATELLCRQIPGTRILAVSLHAQPSYAKKIIQNGALGYLTKNSTKEELFHAILEVSQGRKYVCQEMKSILSREAFGGEDAAASVNSLSQRELEIIGYIKKGYTSAEIAGRLDVAVKTVEGHRYNILRKLGLKNTPALMDYVSRHLPPE